MASRPGKPAHRVLPATPGDPLLGTPRGSPGGVGWRPNVPHIVIHSGDIVGACPFPADYGPIPEWIEPESSRGLAAPIAFLRLEPYDFFEWDYPVWTYEPPSSGFPYGVWDTNWNQSYSLHTVGYYRAGHLGPFWVGPSNAATLPGTLEALAALDIAVVTISNSNSFYSSINQPGEEDYFGSGNELSYSDMQTVYATNDEHAASNWLDAGEMAIAPDLWGGAAMGDILWAGAALAFLTGAYIDEPSPTTGTTPTAMSYTWQADPRFDSPTAENASSFVDFLTPRIIQLAADLGNARRFDIALCIDNSGSFAGDDSVAVQVFRDLVTRFRAEARDINVAVSRYSEYSSWHYPFADTWEADRPFILMRALSSIETDEEYEAMLTTLQDVPPGGGGDPPETYIEGLYQIATGVGLDGSVDKPEFNEMFGLPDGSTEGSGEATVRGTLPGITDDTAGDPEELAAYLASIGYTEEQINDITGLPDNRYWGRYYSPEVAQGFGYMAPGYSGDVPSFEGAVFTDRGTALPIDDAKRVYRHEP